MSAKLQPNRCPVCGELAITGRERLLKVPRFFSCRRCDASLRLHYLPTAIAILIAGLGILWPYIYFGLTVEWLFCSAVSIALFFIILWLAPLAELTHEDKT